MAKRKTKQLSVSDLIHEGLIIIQEELGKIKNNLTAQLRDKQSMDLLNDYLRTLVSLKREERQANVEAELSHLQDENLDKLAKEALLYLKKSDAKQEP